MSDRPWVKTSERLPEEGQVVETKFFEDGPVRLTARVAGDSTFYARPDGKLCPVRYWRPIEEERQ